MQVQSRQDQYGAKHFVQHDVIITKGLIDSMPEFEPRSRHSTCKDSMGGEFGHLGNENLHSMDDAFIDLKQIISAHWAWHDG